MSYSFAFPWTAAHQVPLSMGFSRQEYWSGLPFPPPGDLPHPGIEPMSLVSLALAGGFFTTVPQGFHRKPLDPWTDGLWSLCSWSSWTEKLWASYSNLSLWLTKALGSSYAHGELLSFLLMLKKICSNYLIDIKEHPKHSINSKFKENLGKNFQYFVKD